MGRKTIAGCVSTASTSSSCCKVESLISVDEKGQMVLPKDMRERAGIRPGEKMALISWEKDGSICCFTLIKADYLAQGIKDFLGPIMQGVYAGNQMEVKL
jgi:antitoxin PrlF